MAAPQAKRDVVEFAPNVPQQIALKWPDGKIVESRNGSRMMYSLTDGRVMFLDLDVGGKINLLELSKGECFWIRKTHSGRKGEIPTWDVWKDGLRYEPEDQQPDFGSEIEIQVRESMRQIEARRVQVPAPAPVGAVEAEADAPVSPPRVPFAPAPVATPGKLNNQAVAYTTPQNIIRPRTKLEDALKTVVHACHAAQVYAAEIGFAMPPWTSEDLRTMANTLIIDSQRNGARNV